MHQVCSEEVSNLIFLQISCSQEARMVAAAAADLTMNGCITCYICDIKLKHFLSSAGFFGNNAMP